MIMDKYQRPYTTLRAIRSKDPCVASWKNLLSALEKTKEDEEPLSILRILNILGVSDAFWCFRTLGQEWRMFERSLSCAIVEKSLKYASDPRPAKALKVTREYVKGNATKKDLIKAQNECVDTINSALNSGDFAVASAVNWAIFPSVFEASLRAAEADIWSIENCLTVEEQNKRWLVVRKTQELILRNMIGD